MFLSHNCLDKVFVRTLAQDLRAMGVKVWLDEAELNVGDSLVAKISSAIDEMKYLAVVLSPHSVSSRWVNEELHQALIGQLSNRDTVVLPILLADCEIPGFLRDRVYADFRNPENYDDALRNLLRSVGIENARGREGTIHDPFAKRLDRVRRFYVRPKAWHCIACGWRSEEPTNDYLCMECGAVRPFSGDSSTQVICPECGEGSLGLAAYCEWCGTNIHRTSGQSVTYRCLYDTARVVGWRCSSGARADAGDAVVTLSVQGREISDTVSVDCVVEETYVISGQLVFRGTPLYRVVRLS